MTYRNKSFASPVTGSVGPKHHTDWEIAMDDSLKTFLDKQKIKNFKIRLLYLIFIFSKERNQKYKASK